MAPPPWGPWLCHTRESEFTLLSDKGKRCSGDPAPPEHLMRSVSHFWTCVIKMDPPPRGPWLCHTCESEFTLLSDQGKRCSGDPAPPEHLMRSVSHFWTCVINMAPPPWEPWPCHTCESEFTTLSDQGKRCSGDPAPPEHLMRSVTHFWTCVIKMAPPTWGPWPCHTCESEFTPLSDQGKRCSGDPAPPEHLMRSVSHFWTCVIKMAPPPWGPWPCHTCESEFTPLSDQGKRCSGDPAPPEHLMRSVTPFRTCVIKMAPPPWGPWPCHTCESEFTPLSDQGKGCSGDPAPPEHLMRSVSHFGTCVINMAPPPWEPWPCHTCESEFTPLSDQGKRCSGDPAPPEHLMRSVSHFWTCVINMAPPTWGPWPCHTCESEFTPLSDQGKRCSGDPAPPEYLMRSVSHFWTCVIKMAPPTWGPWPCHTCESEFTPLSDQGKRCSGDPAPPEQLMRSVTHFRTCVIKMAPPPWGPWPCHTCESEFTPLSDQGKRCSGDPAPPEHLMRSVSHFWTCVIKMAPPPWEPWPCHTCESEFTLLSDQGKRCSGDPAPPEHLMRSVSHFWTCVIKMAPPPWEPWPCHTCESEFTPLSDQGKRCSGDPAPPEHLMRSVTHFWTCVIKMAPPTWGPWPCHTCESEFTPLSDQGKRCSGDPAPPEHLMTSVSHF